MTDLILYLGITVVGYFAGSRLRSHKEKIWWTGKIQTLAITVLVLLMGMRMGSNPEITENLNSIGLSAFVMTLMTMSFSIGAITITRKLMGIDRQGQLKGNEEEAVSNIVCEAEKSEEKKEPKGISTMTVVILVSVIVGMLFGYFFIRRHFAGNISSFDNAAGICIKAGLCVLLFFVGIDLGLDGTVVENFRKVGLRILAFPAAVIFGTLGGALLAGVILGISAKEALAVGAGFGWYTLAPGIIMEAGYLTASAISFLHNVMRELFSILFIPLVASKIGYIETTGMPGAAAMDVCLPIVEKSTRSDIAVYSFVSGVVLSILVPVLVPLIIG